MGKSHVLFSLLVSLLFLFEGFSVRAVRTDDGSESWGYVEVRPKAHMFWWYYRSLYRTQDPNKPWPIILWLQGGPGASGVGIGNFEEIGPLDTYLKPRNSTWLTKADLLFVDNPVGTGYSFVEDLKLLVKTDDEAAADLTTLLIEIFNRNETLQNSPLYIVAESYGGKYAVTLGLSALKAIQAGKLKLKLGGIALGDTWISPEDFVFSWGPLLKDVSRLDNNGLKKSNSLAEQIKQEIDTGKFVEATDSWSNLEDVISRSSNSVDFYNFLLDSGMDPVSLTASELSEKISIKRYSRYLNSLRRAATPGGDGDVDTLMNGVIKKKLKIIPKDVVWGGQSDYVFSALEGDFMKPRIDEEIEDAQRICRTIVDCFERASLPNLSDEKRRKLLHFVVVGGGPTGVEFAAELHDYVNEDLVKLYPKVKEAVKITLLEATDHILNMFDKRITAFAEEKFQRDGINLKTGAMVVKVTDKEISTKQVKNGGEISTMPYGMVVWSTGIGTRPVIMDFMKQVGQGSRRVLATDEWLRVERSDSIYALGDCATINQRRVMEDIWAIFQKADKDNSGTLTVKEFQEVLADICERYPQVELYLKNQQMSSLVDLLKDPNRDSAKESVEVNLEEFKAALSQVDSQMKNLPATAQVAAQQGSYLADCFNRMEQCEVNPEGPLRFRGEGRHRFRPFRYRHLGQFAPLGGEQTAAQLPGDWVSIGHSTQWLWYSVYASKLVSWRTRALVVTDWTRRFIFGRDSSGI